MRTAEGVFPRKCRTDKCKSEMHSLTVECLCHANPTSPFLPKIVMIFLTVMSLKFLLSRKSASWPPRIPLAQATKKGREDRKPF